MQLVQLQDDINAEETSVLVDNNTIGTLYATSTTSFVTDEFDVTNYIKGKTSTSIGIHCSFGAFIPFVTYYSYCIDCVILTIT